MNGLQQKNEETAAVSRSQATRTNTAGIPINKEECDVRAGKRGPLLMSNTRLYERNSIFNRERIPERVVHANGSGAFGTFRVTKDVTKYTKAKFLSEVGKETPMVARFSTVAGESGFADADRDVRGFGLRFYTEEGNFDCVGNNTPIFFLRDPTKFQDFIHSQKRNPRTHLRDWERRWDWWSQAPESIHQVLILFSDRGIPKDYRHMHGYGSHTFSMINDDNERVWIKWHFRTQQGYETLMEDEAMKLRGENPDSSQQDLFESIQNKDFPKWQVCIQVMTDKQAQEFKFDPFDLTKVWSHQDFPLIEVGEFELNRNPDNYFADIEQLAIHPGNLPPGLGASPDPVLQIRMIAYTDAANYRIGVNHAQLPVNRPKCPVAHNVYQDGTMNATANNGGEANYNPNSFETPQDMDQEQDPPLELHGDARKYATGKPDDIYEQPRALFQLLGEDEQHRMYSNIAGKLAGIKQEIIDRQLDIFDHVDEELGRGVRKAMEQSE
eukprot:m.264044 g.264044  ORF g.264044 m.264044 type:complete len:496 (+) comp17617_c0_seq1:39-1526(+)